MTPYSNSPLSVDEKMVLFVKIGSSLVANLSTFQIGRELPLFRKLFKHNTKPLTVRRMKEILSPQFSEQGSNARKFEESTWQMFGKYLVEVNGMYL